jgi:hypothetical protein
MPYIAAADRAPYDRLIDELARLLADRPADRRKGHANYVITQILRKGFGVHETAGQSYSTYADVIGTLECAKLEMYRRWVAPYEDGAIARHGDV